LEHTTDILIIGAGVIGTAIAYHLRKRGADVTILEREEVGSKASSAAAGLLAPLGPLSGPGPYADLLLSSFSLFSSLIPELEEVSGIHLEYEQTGALRTVRNPKRVSNLKKRLESWKPLGLTMYWLTGDEARQQEPLLSPDVCAAIYAPEESQIKAPQLVKAFSIAASRAGARIYTHTEAANIKQKKKRIIGVHTTQGDTITCNHLILTTGAWSAHYGQQLNLDIPVSPLRGQILSLQEPNPSLKHIIFGDTAYIAPKGKSIIIGATKEEAGFEVTVTDEGTKWLRDTAIRFLPTLEQCNIETAWAGLRPSTPDKHPILGPAPHWENVTLAVGHNAVGIILSPITGQTIAEVVTTRHIPEIILPFSLERFQSNEKKVMQSY
jgi:glycine oxidase